MNLGGSNQLLGAGGAPSMAFDGRDGHHHNRRHPSSSADPSASTGAPAVVNHNGSENHPQSTNLNILNQASNISQLSANNTSFDPAHQLADVLQLPAQAAPLGNPAGLLYGFTDIFPECRAPGYFSL